MLSRVCLILLLSGCGAPPAESPDLSVAADLAPMCRADKDCAGPTPRCDTQAGKCVGCTADDQCGEGQICKASACAPGCSAMKGCGDAGTCDVPSGQCRTCMTDADCPEKAAPRCDTQSRRCVECLPQADNCPNGRRCVQTNGVYGCALGCKDDAGCIAANGPTSICCGGTCVDKASDGANCGACGASCMGKTCCAGNCTDTDGDVANCGLCGRACSAAHAVPACAMGKCAVGKCNAGFADCDQLAANGCEIDTNADKDNCLGCGNSCTVANGTAVCAMGCAVGGCNAGRGDCDKQYANGCESDLMADAANCGMCGAKCVLANAIAACTNGGCRIAACTAGFGDCDGNAANGCEVNVNTSSAHCGMCGKPCNPANGTGSCVNGICNIQCNAGFANCDGNGANGCETATDANLNNCGSCGKVCSVANGTPACIAGVCRVAACNAGFFDCDGNPLNGCEIDLRTDKNNCGQCGRVCPGACVNSACAGPACSNGSFTDCNVANTTLIPSSAWVDQTPPQGWVQCAGFTNTAGDDVAHNFLDNCLNTTRLRIRVYTANNALEEDISVPNLNQINAWPNFNYLGGTPTVGMKTFWGATTFFTTTDGKDACAQAAAPGGDTFGTGNGSVAIVVGGNTGYNEYRVSCGGMNLPDRKIALYK